MVILHFSCIDDSKTSGVCVIVPQHVHAQGNYAETALVNVNGIRLPDVKEQLPFVRPFDVRKLPEPFDRPDMAVFHECYRPAYLVIARNLRKHKIPYVIVPHGELRDEAQQKKHLKKWAANLLLFNRFIDHAAALQCLSEKEILATHFGRKRFIGTNGVEIPETVKQGFREDCADFLYIGRYEWRPKGLDLLFDAIRIKGSFLRENRCRFLLYGPSDDGFYADVRSMVRERGIEDLVKLNREILGNEKTAALLDADIFAQTSRHEGMPMGILEAMSYGLPCLVTEGTSLGAEIADAKAGWSVETTAEDIASGIVRAVQDRSRWSEFGANGRNAVREHFSWDLVAAGTVKQYRKLILDNNKR